MASLFLHCFKTPALRSYLAEFISTFLFIFVAVGSTISARMLTPDVSSGASSLVATALAQGFALFAMVYIAADVSGAHVNPAVTFAMALCGHIAIPTTIFYCVVQIVAATLACLLLHVASADQTIPTTRIATETTGFGGVILESVITFALVYTVFMASEPRFDSPRKNQTGSVAGPLAVGLVAGAGILTAGSLTGASMNPARSFGPAIVSGDFKNQGVYWVGPMIGGSLASLVHQYLVYPSTGSNLGDDVAV